MARLHRRCSTSFRHTTCVLQTATQSPPPAASGSLPDQAEQAFSAGNLDQAGQLVAMALQKDPNDGQAGYLKRIIERERQPQNPVKLTLAR